MAGGKCAFLLSRGSVQVPRIRSAVGAAGLALRVLCPDELAAATGQLAHLVVVDAEVSGADALQLLMLLRAPAGRDLPPAIYLVEDPATWRHGTPAPDERHLATDCHVVELLRAIVELTDAATEGEEMAIAEAMASTVSVAPFLEPVTYRPGARRLRVVPVAGGQRRLASAAAAFMASLALFSCATPGPTATPTRSLVPTALPAPTAPGATATTGPPSPTLAPAVPTATVPVPATATTPPTSTSTVAATATFPATATSQPTSTTAVSPSAATTATAQAVGITGAASPSTPTASAGSTTGAAPTRSDVPGGAAPSAGSGSATAPTSGAAPPGGTAPTPSGPTTPSSGAIPGAAAAGGAPVQLPRADAEIEGRVTAADSCAPLPGAQIAYQGPTVGYATTDADGRYRISGLLPGAYRIVVSALGYADASNLAGAVAATRTSDNLSLAPTQGTAPAAEPRSYKVRAGDTLSGIAERSGTTVDALRSVNRLPSSGRIIAGQVINIPVTTFGQK